MGDDKKHDNDNPKEENSKTNGKYNGTSLANVIKKSRETSPRSPKSSNHLRRRSSALKRHFKDGNSSSGSTNNKKRKILDVKSEGRNGTKKRKLTNSRRSESPRRSPQVHRVNATRENERDNERDNRSQIQVGNEFARVSEMVKAVLQGQPYKIASLSTIVQYALKNCKIRKSQGVVRRFADLYFGDYVTPIQQALAMSRHFEYLGQDMWKLRENEDQRSPKDTVLARRIEGPSNISIKELSLESRKKAAFSKPADTLTMTLEEINKAIDKLVAAQTKLKRKHKDAKRDLRESEKLLKKKLRSTIEKCDTQISESINHQTKLLKETFNDVQQEITYLKNELERKKAHVVQKNFHNHDRNK